MRDSSPSPHRKSNSGWESSEAGIACKSSWVSDLLAHRRTGNISRYPCLPPQLIQDVSSSQLPSLLFMLRRVTDGDTHGGSRTDTPVGTDGSGLVGTAEIADMLQVSRQRVYQLSQLTDWPAPVARLAMGAVWRTADIEAWARARGRET